MLGPKGILFVLILGSIFSTSCNKVSDSQDSNKSSSIIDDLGRTIIIPLKVERILSISPAMTETLFFACRDSQVVGRSQACNFPPEAIQKPIVSTYPFDLESIIALAPDIVFSESGITSSDQVKMLENNGINLFMADYKNMDDVFKVIRKVAGICQCEREKEIANLEGRLKALKNDNYPYKKALGLIWTDPIYVYGHNTLFTDQLKFIGMENAVDSLFQRPYPEITREYLLKIDPDIIFGSSFERLDSTLFKNYPELKRINAYKTHSIFEIESDILTRPGPRSVLAIELMKNAVYGK